MEMEKGAEEKAELLMEKAEAPTTRLEAELAFRFLGRHIPDILRGDEDRRLNILDVGSGVGEASLRFAALGHRVTLLEPQACLLETAMERAREQALDRTADLRFINERIENLEACLQEDFDLILCHETIEYVDDPLKALNIITRVLRPRGLLSLVFLNRYGLIMDKVLREGNVKEAMDAFDMEEFSTPLHRGKGHLYSDIELRMLLEPLGYNIEGEYGLLVFSEYIDCSLFEPGQCFKGMLELEERAGSEPHLKYVGKYTQLVCSKS
jgi:S-adenosylmethionine-dependent methyltransferase